MLALVAALLCAISTVSGRPFSIQATSTNSTNGTDGFSVPPSGWESASPGTIFNSRQVEVSFAGNLSYANVTNSTGSPTLKAYQILYRTTGVDDSMPLAAIATTLQASDAAPNQLLAFGIAEDAINGTCAPSLEFVRGASPDDASGQATLLSLVAFLNQGYTVVSADYEGPDSAFASGFLEGHAVLDSVRAALNFTELGFNSTVTIAAYGYSGSSIAMGWAAALQPVYAPELNFAGIALGGTPANLTGTLLYLSGSLFAGFSFAGVLGIARTYDSLASRLAESLTAAGHRANATASSLCATDLTVAFANQSILSPTYNTAGEQFLYDAAVQEVLAPLTMGANASLTPTAPLLVYSAVHDEVIPFADINTTVAAWKANGIRSLEFLMETGEAEHQSLQFLAFPLVFNWLSDRFAGVPPVSGVNISSIVLPSLPKDGIPEALAPVLGNISELLTHEIGTSDGIVKAGIAKAAAALSSSTPVSSMALGSASASGSSASASAAR